LKNIEKILQYIEAQDLSISEFERSYGFSNGYLGNTNSRGADLSNKILDKFQKAHPEIYKKVLGDGGVRKTPSHGSTGTQGDNLTEAILSITRSNEGLVRANTVIAEANLKLAEKVSASESEEIPLAVESRFSDLLELIAELGTGTRWKSKQEALAVLSKLWHGKKRDVLKVGIRDGSGK